MKTNTKSNIIFIAFLIILFLWIFDSYMQYLVNKPLSNIWFFGYKIVQFGCYCVIGWALRPYNY